MIDGQIDGMKLISGDIVLHGRKKSPRRIVSPFHLGLQSVFFDDRSDEAGLVQEAFQLIARCLQQVPILDAGRGHSLLGVVKIVKGVAVTLGVRLDMKRGSAGEITVGCSVLRQQPGQFLLIRG